MTNTAHTHTGSTLPDISSPYVLERDEGDHVHFLNHLATRKIGAGQDGSMSVVEFLAPRGFGPPLHCHDHEDEVMIILEGEISFISGDDEFTGRTGATVFLPHGAPHTFQVLSETARYTTINASRSGPPVFDRMVVELGEPTDTPELPEPTEIDPAEVATVLGANGITVLGPPPC